jgi:hypothetical protein
MASPLYTRQNTKLSLTLLERVNAAAALSEVLAVATRFDCYLQMIDDGLSAQELWGYFFDAALPHSDIEARARVRAALLLSEESADFDENDEEAENEDNAPIEYKSMDGPPAKRRERGEIVCSPVHKMPAFDQCRDHARRDHQHAAIIENPNGKRRPSRIRQRPCPCKDQQVRCHKGHCAKADAISREIAVPRTSRHASNEQCVDGKLETRCPIRSEEKGDVWRQHKDGDRKQLLAKHRLYAWMPQEQPDCHDMPRDKSNRAPNHVNFDQAIAERPKPHNCGQQSKLAAIMTPQRIGYKKADSRHFPDYSKQLWHREILRRWIADAEDKAGQKKGAFMGEVVGHGTSLAFCLCRGKHFC